jgi:hypothetical protein
MELQNNYELRCFVPRNDKKRIMILLCVLSVLAYWRLEFDGNTYLCTRNQKTNP